MKNEKNVKLTYHILVKRYWKKNKDEETVYHPLYEIIDILKYINRLARLKKFYDMKNGKFCFLESVEFSTEDPNVIAKGYFKSARNEFRPNLINKKTGLERKNPKDLSEGDIEKTHFLFKCDKNKEEVYLLLESNYHGLAIGAVVEYLTAFQVEYLRAKKIARNFSIVQASIPGKDFFEELERLKRAKIAEVYFDKQLLGSKALNFSNRTISLKKDLKLVASAELGENISEVAVDFFNALNLKGSNISKVRVFGNDSKNNEVILDTSLMTKRDFIKADLNPETGEVITSQIFSGLVDYAKNI